MGSQATRGDFVSDIEAIRKRARQHIEDGAVTENYKGNRETVIRILNDALATEIVCVLRYKRHYYMASGINSEAVRNEFLEHSQEEQEHADKIAERITQLDGEPDLNPEGLLDRSHSQYVEGTTLVEVRALIPTQPDPLTRAVEAPPPALYVQAGAFAEQRNAQRVVERLHAAGLRTAFILTPLEGKAPVYRVRLGPVNSVAEFDRLAVRLAALGFADARLTMD